MGQRRLSAHVQWLQRVTLASETTEQLKYLAGVGQGGGGKWACSEHFLNVVCIL